MKIGHLAGHPREKMTTQTGLKDFSHRTLVGIKNPGEYRDTFSDVKGLFLRVKSLKNGDVSKAWIWRYTLPGSGGKRETISPGLFPAVGAAEAREQVREYAKALKTGVNPKTLRDKAEKEAALSAQRHTFRQVAGQFWEAHNQTWKNVKVRAQWKDSWMQTYTYPTLGNIDVADIRLADIEQVMRPIWQSKHPTAKKILQAIAAVLEYAVAKGWRDEDLINPAKQKERLIHLLAKVKRKRVHHPSLHYEDGPAFYADLRAAQVAHLNAVSFLGLEFALLTGIRTNNVLTLDWSEVDLDKRIVDVPASKMKGSDKDFSYPLTQRAIEILDLRKQITGGQGYVFTGRARKNGGDEMSSGAMLEAVKVLCGVKGVKKSDKAYKPKFIDRQSKRRITVHGFRSTLFSWAEDHGHKLEDIEAVIAHTKGDANLAAYARGNKLEIRREICEQFWAHLSSSDKLP